MDNLRSSFVDAKNESYKKGLRFGKMAAKFEKQRETRLAYEKGFYAACKKFFPAEVKADPGMVLPNVGFQKKTVDPIFQIYDFLDSHYRPAALGREGAAELYNNYKNYCIERNIQTRSYTFLGRVLSTKFYKHKSNGKIIYHGIARV